MPRKLSTASKDKSRGSCCTVDVVTDFLKNGTFPKDFSKSDKKSLQRRARSFILISGEVYFTRGRSRHNKGLGDGDDQDEDDPDLRKVVFSEAEKEELVNAAHVGEDGSHFGVERTINNVSNQYYWLGITNSVRDVVINCSKCKWLKNQAEPSRTPNPKTGVKLRSRSRRAEPENSGDEEGAHETGNESEGYDATEDDNDLSNFGFDELPSIKQEIAVGLIKDFMGTNGAGYQTPTKDKTGKSSNKSSTCTSTEKERGSCTSLENVHQYLLNGTIPEGFDINNRRFLKRRSKSFVLENGEMYFTGARKSQRGTAETEDENTQTLRKVVFSDEERQAIVKQAHIQKNGKHQGVEKTSKQVASHYYWLGITYYVREAIFACPKCSSRSKNARCDDTFPAPSTSTENESEHAREEEMDTGTEVDDASGTSTANWDNHPDLHSVKQELLTPEPPGQFSDAEQVQSRTLPPKKKVATGKGAKKSTPRDERERGYCTSVEVVKQYILTGKMPEGFSKVEKRNLRRRATSFVAMKDEVYFTGGRSRHHKVLMDYELGGADNPENEPAHTQILRRVVCSEEEQQKILYNFHVNSDGTHNGVERTVDCIANEYYWVGITKSVRSTIMNCPKCSSRSKTVSRVIPQPPKSDSMSSSFNTSQTTAVPTSGNKSSRTEWGAEMESDLGDEDDNDYGNEEDARQGEASFTDSQSIKQECSSWPTVVFPASNEVSNYFWQKVEIQIFGPFQAGKKQVYVTVALDSYSQFPEAVTMEVLSSSTLTNFFLNLFCRYGVMEKVLLLQNQVTKNKDLNFNMPDLQQAGISPYMYYPPVSPLDERWNHIEKSLSRFVGLYPDFWFQCLEAFMVPLRITLPPEAVYSPYYLVHGREAPVPDKLNQVCGMNTSLNMEVQLTEDEAKQTTDLITAAYGIHSSQPSIPATLSAPHSVKEPTQPRNESPVQGSPESRTEPEPSRYTGEPRRSTRTETARAKKMKMTEEAASEKEMTTDDETAFVGTSDEVDDGSDTGSTYTPSVKPVSKVINERSSLMLRRKSSRPRRIVRSSISKSPDIARAKLELKKMKSGVHTKIVKTIQQVPLETLYFILKRYLEQKRFPRCMSRETKKIVTRLSAMFCVKDGKLYSSAEKSAGRLIITEEKSRFCLLRKAHARGETHHNRTGVLKYLSDLNVFWNGMSLDVDAFIHSCPECISVNPLGNMSVVRIPSKSASLSANGRMEDEPHFSEDEEEESSYEDLIQYLTDKTFPPTTTPEQQSRIQQRSQSFCIIDGSLCYHTKSRTAPRQVLFSETSKHSAILGAHIENEHHLSQQDTQARLRGQYFWSGMTFDVLKGLMSCCMGQALSTQPVLHRYPVIQERVEKFHSYYSTKTIPKLDPSTIAYSKVGPGRKEAGGGYAEECILKAVEEIIKGLSKSLFEKGKNTETGEKEESTGDTLSSSSRKRLHKCQYCGKVVGGSVAFKIHMYKYHTGVKPFTCTTCGKSYTSNSSLLTHASCHSGVKPYLCNQCGKGFFRSDSLTSHLKVHIAGRKLPLSCNDCGRSFSTQHRLTLHKKCKHPVEAKVLMCNQCGKHFSAARSLRRHEDMHNGIRRYQCQFCSKAFFRSEYLAAHLLNHPEYDPELEKRKPRQRARKSQSRTERLSRATHWQEQGTSHIPESTITNLDAYQSVSAQHSLPSSQVTSSHIAHTSNFAHSFSSHVSDVPSTSAMAHSQMVHHSLHPIMHTARLMNVAGSHGPLSLAMSSGRPQVEMVHAGNGQEILLQHDTLPVQYGVDCLSGEAQGHLSEADLNAIHMLGQSGMSAATLHNM